MMADVLSNPQALAVVFLLMLVIWIQQLVTGRDAYRRGAVDGFALGIDQALEILIKKHMVTQGGDSSKVMDKAELVKMISPIAAANIIKKVKELEAELKD